MSRTLMLLACVVAIYFVLLARSEPVHAKKVVIEVDTPHGRVSGSTVVELKSFQAPWWHPVGGTKGGTVSQGEALHVDLGAGKHLFMVMNDQTMSSIKDSLMPNRLQADGRFKPDWTPVMVTFDDIADANSVRQVRPEGFSSIFHGAYSLRSLRAVDTRDKAAFGSLEALFPELHRQLMQPSAVRLNAAGIVNVDRSDIRNINWTAFEDKRW